MLVKKYKQGDFTIVKLLKPVTTDNKQWMTDEILIQLGNRTTLILDVVKIGQATSFVLNFISSIKKIMDYTHKNNEANFILVNAKPDLTSVLEITQLSRIIPSYATPDDLFSDVEMPPLPITEDAEERIVRLEEELESARMGTLSVMKHLEGINTDLVKKDLELEKHLAHIKKLGAERDKYLKILTYDLRSPLGSIFILIQTMLDGHCGPLQSDQKSMLSNISESLKKSQALIDEIVDVENMSIEDEDIALENYNIVKLIKERYLAKRDLTERHKVEVHLDLQDDDAILKIDPARLGQAIDHVLDDVVFLAASGQNIKIRGGMEGKNYRISVYANPQRTEGHEPKANADFGKAQRRFGLAMVKKIVALHKGNVEIEEQSESGNYLTINLPIN